jgi:hypothetical protein
MDAINFKHAPAFMVAKDKASGFNGCKQLQTRASFHGGKRQGIWIAGCCFLCFSPKSLIIM